MAIHVNWDTEFDDMLIIVFDGEWTWREYYEMGGRVAEQLKQRDQITHIVYDFSASSGMTRSPSMHMRYFVDRLPAKARAGLAIYIGATNYWRTCVSAFNRVYPHLGQDHVYVSDLHDAREAVRRKREQIELLADDDLDDDVTIPSRTTLGLTGRRS